MIALIWFSLLGLYSFYLRSGFGLATIWLSPNNLFDLYLIGVVGVVALLLGWCGAYLYAQDRYDIRTWPHLPVLRLVIWGLLLGRFFALLNPSPAGALWGVTRLSDLIQNPVLFFDFRYGGLDAAGVMLGGILVLWFTYRRTGRFASELLPAAAFGHGIGSMCMMIGRFINQEFYGAPTDSWLGFYVDTSHRLPVLIDFTTYQPIFIHYGLLILIGTLMLAWWNERGEILVLFYLLIFVFAQLYLNFAIIIPHARFLPLFILIALGFTFAIGLNRARSRLAPSN